MVTELKVFLQCEECQQEVFKCGNQYGTDNNSIIETIGRNENHRRHTYVHSKVPGAVSEAQLDNVYLK
jgi:hypothetical protein